MGLKFLKKCSSWAEVTRDERFFCAHLHMLIEKIGVSGFVAFLNTKEGIDIDPTANWEAAFEACFYRDFWQHKKKEVVLFSPKRTFDLCLFSNHTIVIIEAKSHGGFTEKHLAEFDKDEDQVKGLTKVDNVLLLALA
jgi:hypothetical protein